MMERERDDTTGEVRSPIVMLTDFGRDSFYVGAMKAAAMAVDPRAAVVDLTHGIRPFAVEEASFALSLVWDLWPEGSVFLVVVDPGVGGERRNIVVEAGRRFFVGPDNGWVSDIAARRGVDAVFSIRDDAIARVRKHRATGRTFLGRDVFAPAAAYIAGGGEPSGIGERVDGCIRLALPKVEVRTGFVRGQERYVDDFGNVLTNITAAVLAQAFADTPLADLRVEINNSIGIDGVTDCFSRGAVGALLAILDSWGVVELSVNQGRAVDRFAALRPVVVEVSGV